MPTLPNPFASVSPGDPCCSLPSGESEPSVTLACAPGESRFVLDVDAFLRAMAPDIEPLPVFIAAPSQAYLRASEMIPMLEVLAGRP